MGVVLRACMAWPPSSLLQYCAEKLPGLWMAHPSPSPTTPLARPVYVCMCVCETEAEARRRPNDIQIVASSIMGQHASCFVYLPPLSSPFPHPPPHDPQEHASALLHVSPALSSVLRNGRVIGPGNVPRTFPFCFAFALSSHSSNPLTLPLPPPVPPQSNHHGQAQETPPSRQQEACQPRCYLKLLRGRVRLHLPPFSSSFCPTSLHTHPLLLLLLLPPQPPAPPTSPPGSRPPPSLSRPFRAPPYRRHVPHPPQTPPLPPLLRPATRPTTTRPFLTHF